MTSKRWLIGSISVFGLVVMLLFLMEPADPVLELHEQAGSLSQHPPITVVESHVGTYTGEIISYAEVKPLWSASIKAHVRGEVKDVKAFAGQVVKKGQLIIQLDDMAYQTQLAESYQALAEAKVSVLEETSRFGQQKRSHPRVEAAKLRLKAASARLKQAQKSLDYTQVVAPFDGILVERQVSIGQTIEVGEPLFSIINNRKLQMTVNLNEKQWQQLDDDWKNKTAILKRTDGSEVAQAKIKRGGGYVLSDTRQYQVFLEWQAKDNSTVLPGEFLQVHLPAKQFENSLIIPESALAQTGKVWFVDQSNTLQFFLAEELSQLNKQIVLRAPQQVSPSNPNSADTSSLSIVKHPMANFLVGERVSPEQDTNKESGNALAD